LPRQARISDRLVVLRSMAHTGAGHPSGSLQLLSGDPDVQDKPEPAYPDVMAAAHHLRARAGGAPGGLPGYVGVNPIVRYDNFTIAGPAFLGAADEPFAVTGDPSAPDFRLPGVGAGDPREARRLRERPGLRRAFDGVRRDLDCSGAARAMDQHQALALDLLTSPAAARAFDLGREDPRVRDRYGRHAFGQIAVVTSPFSSPLTVSGSVCATKNQFRPPPIRESAARSA
jgi:hypothetical protein